MASVSVSNHERRRHNRIWPNGAHRSGNRFVAHGVDGGNRTGLQAVNHFQLYPIVLHDGSIQLKDL